mgnify:CR=1 FL=1
MSTARITLDNPAFSGRFRDFGRGSYFVNPTPKNAQARDIKDVYERPARQIAQTKPAQQRQARSEVLLRNATVQPKITPRRTKRIGTQQILVAMASMVFIAGISVAVLGLRTNKHVEAQVQAVTKQAQANPDGPQEDKPSAQAMASYQVAPDLPRYIRISKLGVMARVTRQGLDKEGAIKAPGNVHDVGWYDGSAKPGEDGAMLMDSHVSGPTTPGAFKNIHKLVAGDTIEVERGDGQKLTYKVVRSVSTKAEETDMAAAMLPADSNRQGLNLITCTGKFNATTQKYEQRIVVYAVPV